MSLRPESAWSKLSVVETRGPAYGTHSLVWKVVLDDPSVPLQDREHEYTLHCQQCEKFHCRNFALKSVPDPGEAAVLKQLLAAFRSGVSADCRKEQLLTIVDSVHKR